VQLSLNTRTIARIGSTPFAIIFGRPFNDFLDFTKVNLSNGDETAVRKMREASDDLSETIWPSILIRTKTVKMKERTDFNQKERIVERLVPGDKVFAIDKTKESKWDPIYEGPFTVTACHRAGNYSIADATGAVLDRKFTISMLKKAHDEKEAIDSDKNQAKKTRSTLQKLGSTLRDTRKSDQESSEHYVVEKIIRHEERNDGTLRYLVKWKKFPDSDNSWVAANDFDGLAMIKKYYKSLRR
jgi:hypothetical protein